MARGCLGLGQAQRPRARLVFLYISVMAAWVAVKPRLVPHWRTSLAELTAGVVNQLGAVLGEVGVYWEFLNCEWHPATELARAADVLRADTVVVGASRHWLRRPGPRWPAGFCDQGTGR
jgi:nucleotide-binding universal stress UspA family protein